MSDEDNSSNEGQQRHQSNSREELTTADAISLFSKQLDNALAKQKREFVSFLDSKTPTQFVTEKEQFKFKYVNNKKQCAFNDSVAKDISAVKSAVLAENKDSAIELIDKVQQDITARNKIVKIGDKHGWDTVSEYEGNPLADDSDDERRLRQAETRAIRKRKATIQTGEQTAKRFQSDKFFRGFSGPSRQGTEFNNNQQIPRFQGMKFQPSSTYVPKKPSEQDICYYCGGTGHWSNNCPEKINKRANSSTN